MSGQPSAAKRPNYPTTGGGCAFSFGRSAVPHHQRDRLKATAQPHTHCVAEPARLTHLVKTRIIRRVMRVQNLAVGIFWVWLLACCWPLSAAEAPTRALSLQECIDLALSRNLDL